jgi:ABC-type nitrate/sulfonate/bicarbonate transport system substrate-binding protein
VRSEVAFAPEILALGEDRVDAAYASEGRALRLERTGAFTIIEDLSRYPDWTLQVANSPYAITVNRDFAERQRDIVVAFLRATVKAGRWANANREAAASFLARVTYYPTVRDISVATATTDFVPNLSAQNLAAVDIQKQFLLEHQLFPQRFRHRTLGRRLVPR